MKFLLHDLRRVIRLRAENLSKMYHAWHRFRKYVHHADKEAQAIQDLCAKLNISSEVAPRLGARAKFQPVHAVAQHATPMMEYHSLIHAIRLMNSPSPSVTSDASRGDIRSMLDGTWQPGDSVDLADILSGVHTPSTPSSDSAAYYSFEPTSLAQKVCSLSRASL